MNESADKVAKHQMATASAALAAQKDNAELHREAALHVATMRSVALTDVRSSFLPLMHAAYKHSLDLVMLIIEKLRVSRMHART